MPQNPCFTNYFPSPASMVGQSNAPLIINSPHAGLVQLFNNGRPFIPLYGLKQTVIDGNAAYEPLTIAENQNANALLVYVELAYEAYRASINFATDNLVGTQISETVYGDYLYKKLFADLTMLARYNNIYNAVRQFWVNANPAWTSDQYQANLNLLISNIAAQADKKLYIPNGYYAFNAPSAFYTAFQAWKAAAPNLVAMYGLELNFE